MGTSQRWDLIVILPAETPQHTHIQLLQPRRVTMKQSPKTDNVYNQAEGSQNSRFTANHYKTHAGICRQNSTVKADHVYKSDACERWKWETEWRYCKWCLLHFYLDVEVGQGLNSMCWCTCVGTYGSTLTGVASLIADNTGGVISVLSVNTTTKTNDSIADT